MPILKHTATRANVLSFLGIVSDLTFRHFSPVRRKIAAWIQLYKLVIVISNRVMWPWSQQPQCCYSKIFFQRQQTLDILFFAVESSVRPKKGAVAPLNMNSFPHWWGSAWYCWKLVLLHIWPYVQRFMGTTSRGAKEGCRKIWIFSKMSRVRANTKTTAVSIDIDYYLHTYYMNIYDIIITYTH